MIIGREYWLPWGTRFLHWQE